MTSGQFCDTIGSYTLFFDAQFDRPFRRFATWKGARTSAGTRTRAGPHSGVTVTFDATRDPVVNMKVGISFVSLANARGEPRRREHRLERRRGRPRRATQWNAILGRIAIAGGTAAEQQTFYSSLYHSLLEPNVFSDENGEYPGLRPQDPHRGRLHAVRQLLGLGHLPLGDAAALASRAARQAGDMMHSLLADYEQSGWLPKWPFADYDSAEMNGDSADPILADAYAFGVRNFDAHEALRAMVKGADTVGTQAGWDVERQDNDQYLTRGWIQVDRRDKTSLDYTVGGSETLEYAIDDNAIAQLAAALGDHDTAKTFTERAGNWRKLFNPATGYLAARQRRRILPARPRVPTIPAARHRPGRMGGGQRRPVHVECPARPPRTVRRDGRQRERRHAKLDRFFTYLNTSRKQPYDWAGNEPALGIPWEYDYAGAPARTQDVVRRIVTDLYAPTPNGEPGNDDLGALSSWYVWATIGMYPETPGTADLVLASPLFTQVTITLGNGRRIEIDAPAASAANRYVQSLQVSGVRAPGACGTKTYACPWLPASVITSGAQLHFTLGANPSNTWATAPDAAPPSITR